MHNAIRENQLRVALITGLIANVLMIMLAGDIWVWRGSMLGELGAWVLEEGGEDALWGASIMYSFLILLAFAVSVISALWFRWALLVLLGLSLFSIASKAMGGFAEYDIVGWYFLLMFSVQTLISATLVWLSWQWLQCARNTGEQANG